MSPLTSSNPFAGLLQVPDDYTIRLNCHQLTLDRKYFLPGVRTTKSEGLVISHVFGSPLRERDPLYVVSLEFWRSQLIAGNAMTGKIGEEAFTVTEKDLPKKFVLKILGHCETSGLWGLKNTREPVEKMVKFAKNHRLCLPIVQLIVTHEGIFVLPLDYKKKSGNDSEVMINVTIPESEIKCVKIGESDKGESKVKDHCFRIKAHFRIVKRIDRGRSKVKKKVEELFKEERDGEEICRGCGREQSKHEKPSRLLTDVKLLEKYKKIEWKRHGIMFYPIDNISYGVQDLVYTRVFSMIEVTDITDRFTIARVPFVCHSFVCESHNTAKTLTHALDAAFQAYGRTLKSKNGG